jgi:hypothetical protein
MGTTIPDTLVLGEIQARNLAENENPAHFG